MSRTHVSPQPTRSLCPSWVPPAHLHRTRLPAWVPSGECAHHSPTALAVRVIPASEPAGVLAPDSRANAK